MGKTTTLLLLLFFFTTSLSKNLCHKDDKNTLLKIKKSLHNPYNIISWDPKDDCCSWVSVECGDATVNHRVTSLDISDDQISAQIPPEVGDLPYLQTLIFRKLSNLTGQIQPTIAKLKYLRFLRHCLILFFFTLLLTASLSKHLCHKHDRVTLLKIKKSLNNLDNFGYWDPKTDCCSWFSIGCGGATVNHRVTSLIVVWSVIFLDLFSQQVFVWRIS